MTAQTKGVGVLVVIDVEIQLAEDALAVRETVGAQIRLRELHAARKCIVDLFEKATRIATTIECDGFVRQSTKNENAGFVDIRSWYALKGEAMELRAALARIGGAK